MKQAVCESGYDRLKLCTVTLIAFVCVCLFARFLACLSLVCLWSQADLSHDLSAGSTRGDERIGQIAVRKTKQMSLIGSKHITGSKERSLFRAKHNMRIFGVIPFIELQNDTQTTGKQNKNKTKQKNTKNEM